MKFNVNLNQKLPVFLEKPPVVNQAIFDSELAKQVSWEPLNRAGANFCTHRLRELMYDGALVFEPTRISRILGSLFMIIPLVMIIFFLGDFNKVFPSSLEKWGMIEFMSVVVFCGVLILFCVVGYWLAFRRKKAFFAMDIRAYYAARKHHNEHLDSTTLTDYTPFSQLVAIQVLSKRCHSKNSSYISWDLNLVKKDASRIFVLSHGAKKPFFEDAEMLASRLNLPLWSTHEPE